MLGCHAAGAGVRLRGLEGFHRAGYMCDIARQQSPRALVAVIEEMGMSKLSIFKIAIWLSLLCTSTTFAQPVKQHGETCQIPQQCAEGQCSQWSDGLRC